MPEAREEQFREIYDRWRPQLIAYALRRAPTPEDAADLVAETFEIAWRKLDVIPPGDQGLLWLYVTARNVMANQRRGARGREALFGRLAAELSEFSSATAAPDAEALAVRSCLVALAPDDREILMLSGWEGLRSAAIACVLGCSPTAARIRLYRARARLQTLMDADEGPLKHPHTDRHEVAGSHIEATEREEVLE